ncbi:2,3-diketo-5-methylthio-1-phosphopentane phosphatase [Hydrogenobaculum sp. Y04AAS1]|uniref:Enolase-phosphatase E1 n=1 Tax=Hydrogenobaculum sp. (strain Y04AAS1) TaxID=380749 RepID=MTNC_HYDS0|nr:RecName: Full=Enolase-phosphatase E1; AltName: Full=2,3-diketo-5-methylthio-1-phosphopentane phosphatase [Hydrogenobaculum sp. Y04AAS1]ACG58195.1 2,3-diketo-5-methylthio-1-phosphopentane phosphatase [Hydrogenobaculum sp. Y04AAS1]HCT67036.1 acireductone synthase [Hydrogenobaculum sp.]
MIKAILTDIEGTTSSINYVKDVMFGYSKKRLKDYLQTHWEEEHVKNIVKSLSQKLEKNIDLQTAVLVFKDFIEKDIKDTLLKELQGHIWEEGFKSGELKGHIYEDAYIKLKELKEKGYKIFAYSSGSIKAQKLFFGYSVYGDITNFFDGFFDTTMGSKKDKNSYIKIASATEIDPQMFLFLSDVKEEINASKEAGMNAILVSRDRPCEEKDCIRDFTEINL